MSYDKFGKNSFHIQDKREILGKKNASGGLDGLQARIQQNVYKIFPWLKIQRLLSYWSLAFPYAIFFFFFFDTGVLLLQLEDGKSILRASLAWAQCFLTVLFHIPTSN